jgi:predicted phage-related endonuclease
MAVDDAQMSEWLAWRQEGITATDVADAYAGTYGGAYAVVANKLGKLPPVGQTDAMARGHRWQPVIADAVHYLTGLYVVGEETWCEHPEQTEWRCTVDGLLTSLPEATFKDVVGVLEVKTSAHGRRLDMRRTEAQVQWQMLVTGIGNAIVADATIDDTTDECVALRLHRITADPFMQQQLAEVADTLWHHILDGTLPDPDVAGALETAKALHAAADPDAEVVDLTSLADDIARLDDIKAAVKSVTDERDVIEARIRDAIGTATAGQCDGWTVSLSKPALVLTREAEAQLLAERPDLGRTVLDRDRAKAEAKELYDALREPAGARRLTIRQKGNKQ